MSTKHPFDDPPDLPSDLPRCHAMIKDLRAEVDRLTKIAETVILLQERVLDLENQIKQKTRARFGRSSAQVKTASLTGTGKLIYEQSIEELKQRSVELRPLQKAHRGGGRTAPDNAPLERTVEHEITELDKRLCPCCGEVRRKIGFDVTKQLDIVKGAIECLKHIQFKYACPKCQAEVIKAPKPEAPIDKGYATEGLIAHIGISKFAWHLPLYRQQSIFQTQSVPIARSSMCRWLKSASEYLEPIVSRMFALIKKSRIVQSDHTTMPLLKKGLGKTHRAYTWIYRGDESYPYVCYDFTESQEMTHPERVLQGYSGVFQTDGASYFNGVIDNGAKRAGCLSHAFRYIEAARDEDPERIDFAIALLKSLFDIERTAADSSEDERYNLRQQFSVPRLDTLKSWLDAQSADPAVLPKSALGKAVTYCLNQWDALCYYSETGFVPAHNNASENGLRPAVLGKKNWLFAGSVDGGKTAAIWMSLIQTCLRLNIDPFDYLKDVLTRIPRTPISEIDKFLPDRWKALHQTTG